MSCEAPLRARPPRAGDSLAKQSFAKRAFPSRAWERGREGELGNESQNILLPVILGGAVSPYSARIDGAISTSDGPWPRRARLLHRTPGTSSASAQWSALQAMSLSS